MHVVPREHFFFSSNSQAKASESLEKLKEMFPVTGSN